MQLISAINLVKAAFVAQSHQSVWADLGCGSGLFTRAIAELLKDDSTIYAIDKDAHALEHVSVRKEIKLTKQAADFGKDLLKFSNLDGVLMANSLHYIKDKQKFIHKVMEWLNENGCFLLVEYDTEKSNPWVPYPLPFQKAAEVLKRCGFATVDKIGEQASLYNRSGMYAAMAKR